MDWSKFVEWTYLGNTGQQVLTFLGFLIGGTLLMKFFLRGFVLKLVHKFTKKTKFTWDEFLTETVDQKLVYLMYYGILLWALSFLTLHQSVSKVVGVLTTLVLISSAARVVTAFIDYRYNLWLDERKDDPGRRAMSGVITIVKIAVWAIAGTLVLDNLGVKMGSLLAGLGVVGLAVAFGFQKILGDLFAYFVIFFDKPFMVGDFIIIDDFKGSVKRVGLKSTFLDSLSGEGLVVSNEDITNARIRNYGLMEQRRVLFNFGVVYNTTKEQLQMIKKMVIKALEDVEVMDGNDVLKPVYDRAHFFQFGDSSLDFEVVYYVPSKDYAVYLDIQEAVNLELKEEFELNGIEFAYPTQKVLLEKIPEEAKQKCTTIQ